MSDSVYAISAATVAIFLLLMASKVSQLPSDGSILMAKVFSGIIVLFLSLSAVSLVVCFIFIFRLYLASRRH
jgi:uncharacterized membrane protein